MALPETYSTDAGPICPYCTTENASAGNDYWAEEQGDGETKCEHCERKFRFMVDFTTHYYGYPIKDPTP